MENAISHMSLQAWRNGLSAAGYEISQFRDEPLENIFLNNTKTTPLSSVAHAITEHGAENVSLTSIAANTSTVQRSTAARHTPLSASQEENLQCVKSTGQSTAASNTNHTEHHNIATPSETTSTMKTTALKQSIRFRGEMDDVHCRVLQMLRRGDR